MKVPDGDGAVQVTVGLVHPPDGHRMAGHLGIAPTQRPGCVRHLAGSPDRPDLSAADADEMPDDSFQSVKVAIPSLAQAFRKGDRLAISISSPGRNFGAWTFTDLGEAGAARRGLGRRPSFAPGGRRPACHGGTRSHMAVPIASRPTVPALPGGHQRRCPLSHRATPATGGDWTPGPASWLPETSASRSAAST